MDSVVTLPAHHDLAAMVGTVREVATRALRQLQRLGAIRLESHGRVRILDRRLLDQFTSASGRANDSWHGNGTPAIDVIHPCSAPSREVASASPVNRPPLDFAGAQR